MTQRLLLTLCTTAAAFGLAGCDRNGNVDSCTGRVPGDLVISEFLNDPPGTDATKEFFEVYNASGKPVALRGMTVYFAKLDGSAPKSHVLTKGEIAAGGYFVFGDATEAAKPDYVDYAYADTIGAMPNQEGLIGLKCGATVVDEVRFTVAAAKPGHARQLDAKLVPDSANNDKEENWCDATVSFATDMYGSPGEPNELCGGTGGQCLDVGTGQRRDVVPPGEGQLFITEFMPDPSAVGDDQGEWIEVYASGDVDLNGLTLVSGTSKSVLGTSDCVHLAAGQYGLIARSADSAVNGGLPAVLATTTVSMPNTSGSLALMAGSTVVDQLSYAKTSSGASNQLDSARLDAQQNDDPNAWCVGTTVYGAPAKDKGTPGAANAACPVVVPTDSCLDPVTQGARKIVVPQPGDLFFVEFMADPTAVSDTAGEWIELYATAPVDLNGLELSNGTSKTVLSGTHCLPVFMNTTALLAHGTDPTLNGGLPTPKAIFAFSLGNTSGTLTLKSGTTVIDQFSYTKVAAGASTQLDAEKLDATQNDDEASWCAATGTYGTAAKDKGTPGTANEVCPVVVPSDSCVDPVTKATRKIVPPAAGDLVVSEFMPDPTAVGDDVGEWIELYATKAVDLNGVEIGNGTSKTVLTGANCIPVAANAYALLAHNPDAAANGGLPAALATFAFSLGNTSGTISLKSGLTVVDQLSYTKTTAGASTQLDSAKLDALQNDDEASWCAATATYGTTAKDKGTPGTANVACAAVTPSGNCTDPTTGNSRAIVTPAAGEVLITELMADPSAVSDTVGEWFEVYAKANVDLNGLELSNGTTKTLVSSASCLAMQTGTYAVFAHGSDPAINGGLPTPAATFGFSLGNSGGSLTMTLKSNGTEIDKVTWATTSAGASSQLDPAKLDATQNDDAANWCKATVGYGAGADKGTPGAANTACAAPADPNSCVDPGTGASRAMVQPAAGDLVIDEFMADPNAVTDTAGEWFEVAVKKDVDLNGIQMGNESTTKTVLNDPAGKCLRVTAGSFVVFAKNATAATNGGLPAVVGTFTFSLTNSGTTARKIWLKAKDGTTLLDEVTYLASKAGASSQLKPDKTDTTGNDDAANWCYTPAGNTYGAGDLGTPNVVNKACP